MNTAASQTRETETFELIQEHGALREWPALKDGFGLICQYNPGFGRSDEQIVCTTAEAIDNLNGLYNQGCILNIRWYQAPLQKTQAGRLIN